MTTYGGVSDWWNWLTGSSGVTPGAGASADQVIAQNQQIQTYLAAYGSRPAPPPVSGAIKVVAGVSIVVAVAALGVGVRRRVGRRAGARG